MQSLFVVERLFPEIISGAKTSTIRWQEPNICIGPLRYICAADHNRTVIVTVTQCTDMPLAKAAAYLGMETEWPDAVMLAGMREHYPNITLNDSVQIIEHSAPILPANRTVARRITNAPLISPHMDSRMGENISTPSLIRMPNWAERRLGTYHLYFADHKGSYIRLAYADDLTGPWHLHRPGALDVAVSLFEPIDPPEPPISERPPWAASLKGGYLYAHVASPDVHIDVKNRCFWMYYHGLLANGDQQTRLAKSVDGVNFTPLPPLLGPPYFRVFQHRKHFYAITFGGLLLRSRSWQGPFETGPYILPEPRKDGHMIRHAEVHRVNDTLHLFYTCIGDKPESILHSTLDVNDDWQNWRSGKATVILQPEMQWEGADLPLTKSIMGGLDHRARELRDPCVFTDDDGQTYLLYCGGGESGIGIATLDIT